MDLNSVTIITRKKQCSAQLVIIYHDSDQTIEVIWYQWKQNTTHNQTLPSALFLFVRSFLAFMASLGFKIRFNPSQGELIGEGPVYIKKSYKNPPNIQPRKGMTIGICNSS